MEARYYVYAYDKVWKDWICCECNTLDEAIMVRCKWRSFGDRNQVDIEGSLRPGIKATMYRVSEYGTINLKK